MASKILHPDGYTVGWICAIWTELVLAQAMMDEIHSGLESQASCDDNSYVLGRIGQHNIVITCLSEIGSNNTGVAAHKMQLTFQHLRFGLMVGIGGGVPGPPNDIRLGDIVVSLPTGQGSGVIQYDLGKMERGGFRRTGSLNKPPKLLRTTVQTLRASRSLPARISSLIAEPWEKKSGADYNEDNEWQYPGGREDILFTANFDHIDGRPTCDICATYEEAIIERGACRNTHLVIHYGNIASGNMVMKSAVQRDEIARKENVISFEMEAAALMDNFSCLVIQGVNNYCDSYKNDKWQPYSAAAAAAYAKRLLLEIRPQAVASLEDTKSSQLAMSRNSESSVRERWLGQEESLLQKLSIGQWATQNLDERLETPRSLVFYNSIRASLPTNVECSE